MTGFLSEVAKVILDDATDMREIDIIVPNRRTGLFLRKSIIELSGKTIWLPKITPIQDIFYNYSDLVIAEDIALIYRLYQTFIKFTGSQEEFDDFYYWGEIILADFDDIDKYLVDAQKLFSTVVDIKEIDIKFDGYEKESIEIIKKFWYNVNQAKISAHKQSFLELWRAMYSIYTEFKSILRRDKIAYQGMIYKDVAESVSTLNFDSKVYYVVGFNALNKCEKQLLNVIKLSAETRFFWDADQYYLKDNYQEAGRFIRENIRKYPPYKNIGIVNNINNVKKDIEVIMAPSLVSQTKLIPDILESWMKEPDFDPQKTAIVLGDENLLIPLMYSIPDDIESYNVSMGFPVRNSMSAAFVSHLLSLQQHCRKTENKFQFYFKDVFSILDHSFIRYLFADEAFEIKNRIILEKKIYIQQTDFGDNELLRSVFNPRNQSLSELSSYLPEICSLVLAKISAIEDFVMEAEFLNRIITRLIALNDCISDQQIAFKSNSIYVKLVNNFMRSLNVAFEGEPLSGMQILGFLETRSLDFDRVIMLSLNEGVFPKTSVSQSLIPYNLRKFYELPSIEFKDSIFAYYFYRLLQQSKEVKLIYSSQSGEGASEASRFIAQIKYELNQKIDFSARAYKIQIDAGNSIVGKKTAENLAKINEHLRKGVSPKAINEYLNCKFKYYLSYIEAIRESETLEEEEDAAFFGKLFHQLMQNIYQPFIGKVLIKEDFKQFTDTFIDAQMRIAIEQTSDFKSETEIDNYENKLIVEIVKKYVKQMLSFDEKNLPFTVLALEETAEYNLQIPNSDLSVKIKGIIDRVEVKDEKYRVLDYKTGKATVTFSSINELFSHDRKSDKSIPLQILLYAMIYSENNSKLVVPGILNVNSLSKEYDFRLRMNRKPLDCFDAQLAIELKGLLVNMFQEILNPEVEFTQTQQIVNCEYCPYKVICNR
ncbi:MAG: PD-(D/E)XK nuclease family protein [Bacteroidales bacterium]|nr:PD-(D/E)XK nuclease family protein [Bacteroidales bacterium]